MPDSNRVNITVESQPSDSARAEIIRADYDYHQPKIVETFQGNIIVPDNWKIGLIVGPSGTGKSVILNTLYPGKTLAPTKHGASVIDDMPEGTNVKDITRLFSKLGFSSVPSWLKPYDVLSMGERMRVDLAYAILTQTSPIVFDEFTSVVDRVVAQNLCIALAKYIRQSNLRFIAVGCHYDVLEWLRPDWAYDTGKSEMIHPKRGNPQPEPYKSGNAGEKHGNSFPDITI